MNDEQSESLEESVRDGAMLHTMVTGNGWSKVARPALTSRREALLSEFLNVATFEDMLRIQQAVNAIDGLLSFIEIKLIEGKSALEELGNRK